MCPDLEKGLQRCSYGSFNVVTPGLGWALYSRQVFKRQKREGRSHEDKTESTSLGVLMSEEGVEPPNILTFAAGFQNCGRTIPSDMPCLGRPRAPEVGRGQTDMYGHLTHWPEKCH